MRIGRSKAGVLLGSLVDRSVDLVALGLLAGAGALLVPGSLDPKDRQIFVALAGIGLVGIAVAAAIAMFLPARRFSYRMRRRFVPVRIAARSMTRRPGAVFTALILALSAQTVFIVLNMALAEACGLHLAFGIWLFAWPLAKLSAAIPLHSGRNRFARSGACCFASAVWSACRSIGRGRDCVGGHRDWRCPRCRAYLIPDDAI